MDGFFGCRVVDCRASYILRQIIINKDLINYYKKESDLKILAV